MKVLVTKNKKTLLIVAAALLLVTVSIGGTLAWLTSQTYGLTNTFDPKEVPNEIHETFPEGSATKSNVQIENTGDMPAYIRVALVPIWRNSDNTGTGLPTEATYTMDINDGAADDWALVNGYYYYKYAVEPQHLTTALVDSCTPKTSGLPTVYEGKYFELQVIAQSIQAKGMGEGVDTAQEAFQIAANATVSNPGV